MLPRRLATAIARVTALALTLGVLAADPGGASAAIGALVVAEPAPVAAQPPAQPTESSRDAGESSGEPPAEAGQAGDTQAEGEKPAEPEAPTVDSAADASVGESVTKEMIESRRSAVESDGSLDADNKKTLVDRLGTAAADVDRMDEMRASAQNWATLLEKAPSRATEILAELAKYEEPAPPVDRSGGISALESRLLDAETRLADANKRLQDAEVERASKTARPPELQRLIAERSRELDDTKAALQALTSEGGPEASVEARRVALRAKVQSLEATIDARRRELAFWNGAKYFESRFELATRRMARVKKEVEELRSALDAARKAEAAKAARAAETLVDRVDRSNPVVDAIAAETLNLAGLRQKLAGEIARTRDETARLESLDERLSGEMDEIRERLERIGLVGSVGRMLREKRKQLPSATEHRAAVKRRDARISELEDERLRLAELQDDLANLEDMIESRFEAEGGGSESARADAKLLLESWKGSDGYVTTLVGQHNEYLNELYSQAVAAQNVRLVSKEIADFIDEHVLWIRSNSPLELFSPRAIMSDLRKASSPTSWRQVGSTLVADLKNQPLLNGLSIFVIVALAFVYGRAHKKLVAIGETADKRTAFLPTLGVFGLTIVMSIGLPLALLVVAWRISAGSATSPFALAIADGLRALAVTFFSIDLFRRLCKPKGLAEAHFRWPAAALAVLRVRLRWLMLFILPSVFLVAAAVRPGTGLGDSLAAVVFCVGLIALIAFFRAVLRPSGRVLSEVRGDDGWWWRLRHLWYALGILMPLALVVLTAVGYFYTAKQLDNRMHWTIWILVGLLVVESLVKRWLLLARRRLAVEHARRKREEAEKEKEKQKALEAATEAQVTVVPEIEIAETSKLDFGAINQQTRKLVRAASAFTLLMGMWFVWSDVLPAFRVLQSVELWGAGTESPVTLQNVLLALVYVLLTVAAGRNIPGLLDVTLLQRLQLQSGETYAITSIARYIIVIVGGVVAFGTVGIGWSKVQWLAAALSVGLGFGLQEIVANFVSGIILLIERPMRVGDVVTVGTVSGKVTQMRIRATTITDWDRRELIVPNKSFITGDLINWTLSDTVSRVVFPVGVAYGSDLRKVMEALLDVAKKSPHPLTDPGPHVLFTGFGDSSLNLELRIFLPNRDQIIAVINDINVAINDAFEREGITIPFPQRDVHIMYEPDGTGKGAISLPTGSTGTGGRTPGGGDGDGDGEIVADRSEGEGEGKEEAEARS